jgi:CDP-paratose 2-epimerase
MTPALTPQINRPEAGSASLRDKLGICQWFHFEDYATVDRAIEHLRQLNIRHFRTGISWADYHRSGGPAWYDWQMSRLRESGLEILLDVWHTPPSIAEAPFCNAPPRRLRDFADFIDEVITDYGDSFAHLELWNEPNNRFKWDFASHDPDWRKFGRMIGDAANWAKRRGCHTVLGGMIPVDHHWLGLMRDYGVLAHVDVIAIHAFPGMWFPHHQNWDWCRDWRGWDAKLDYARAHAGGKPVWVTETGLATWDLARRCDAKHELQRRMMRDLVRANGERFYFYSLLDLDPNREAIEGFHVDENEYHMGLITHDGACKPAWFDLADLLRE